MKILPQTKLDAISKLTVDWGIGEWDILVVGDGSGQGWDSPCGWSSILIDRRARGRKLFDGAMNLGTSGLAELMPYVQALSWYEYRRGVKRRRDSDRPVLSVAIVTDCKGIADQGRSLVTGAKDVAAVKANRPFWAAMLDYERFGYAFSFHHIKRATSALNSYCDDVAGRARRAMAALNKVGPPIDKNGQAVNIYNCNP